MNTQIIPARLARVMAATLLSGSHPENDGEKMCAMEAVAYATGEPWSDHPECVSPVIAAFMRSWNDGLSDDDRSRLLKPLIPRLVNTRGSDAVESRRAHMAADWLIRVNTPAWLRLAKLDEHADALAGLPEIVDAASAVAASPTIDKAARAAWAAWAARAAWAAGAAGAARAAWAAGAAGAAWAAWAAWAARAAWAAGSAGSAWAAGNARGDIKPTVEQLQLSATALIERMIAEGETT